MQRELRTAGIEALQKRLGQVRIEQLSYNSSEGEQIRAESTPEQLTQIHVEHTRNLLEEAQIVVRIAQLRADRVGAPAVRPPLSRLESLKIRIGDIIAVTNGVREGQVPSGIVSSVRGKRINIILEGGIKTWRLEKHVDVRARWFNPHTHPGYH